MENVEYLEIIMTGTKLLTVKEFYDYCDELKSSSKDKLPLFLYSFNLIDKFTFSKFKDSNTIVRINNNNQNTHTKLNIGEYLLQNVIYQKDIFELKNIVDSDLRLEISENELVIYAAGELKECFTILNKSKLDVEFAVKELICESWLECIVNFRQVANYVEDWSDTDYIISLFSNINNEVVEEIKQCKELLFKVMHSMIKEMKRCPEHGKFGVSLITEILKLAISDIDINAEIKEKIINIFIQKQEEKLLKENEELLKSFYKNVYLEQIYDKIYTVKKLEKNDLLEFELLNIRLWDILGNKAFLAYIESRDFTTLTLENLYIGQAFGKDGNRNVSDRIVEGHEKLQRIMSTVPLNKEVALLFFYMRPKGNLFISQYGLEATERLKNLLDNNIELREYVDLAEIALITYLRPKYNIQHVKDDFKSLKTTKVKDIIKSYDGIQIFMDFEKVNWKIVSNDGTNEFISNKPYIHCLFKKEAFGMGVNEIEQLFETYLVDRVEP